MARRRNSETGARRRLSASFVVCISCALCHRYFSMVSYVETSTVTFLHHFKIRVGMSIIKKSLIIPTYNKTH